ncbi:MAG TPA: FkbM family methyltransferase [Gemmatimonadaceae bacterium]|nr:FkbM family methyltransferase [Gemmatimonadaceae bacterium]
MPILGGLNRGRWWSLASAGGGYATGRRAAPQMRLLAMLIEAGDVVWDIGAHHGFMTLCAARQVGASGEVHAFEPCARNRRMLCRHMGWNHVTNAVVHAVALSRFDGESDFGSGTTSKMHALGAGSERVQVRTGASLIRAGTCPAPTFAKIDVEGAEGDLVEGLIDSLPSHVRLLIAMHSAEADRACTTLLARHGFELIPSRRLVASRHGAWLSDPDLMCIGPTYAARTELRERLLQHRF